MRRFVPPASLKSPGNLSSISKEPIACGERFVTVSVTFTSSSATERVGRILLSTDMGILFGAGSVIGMNNKTAMGRTKRVSHAVLRIRLRNTNV